MTKKQSNKKQLTQIDLLMEFFKKNPNRDIPHQESVGWAIDKWKRRRGQRFVDPYRGIRQLHQDGYLIKVKKGVYRYNPNEVDQKNLEYFSVAKKAKILKRDNYRCVICGRGKKEGMDLHVDHIKAKDLGGKATIENGQTLCSRHNMMKKNLKQTETGKKMFIRLYELAKTENDKVLQDFCADILQIYEYYGINGHIEWDK